MTPEHQRLLDDFVYHLRLEQGCSPHSLDAYRRDVTKLVGYVEDEGLVLTALQRTDLHAFLALLYDLGLSPTSQARVLSGVKSFYRYLELEGIVEHNLIELMESPRRSRKLPSVLTVEEIDAMVGAIDLSKPEGHRNKAIVELLYGSGLRVTELITLRLMDVILEHEAVRVIGKGDKQRYVPMSGPSIRALELYLEQRRAMTTKQGSEDTLFLNRRGTGLSRIMIFYIIRDLAALVGIEKPISPHTLRHSFASHMVEGGANLRAVQIMLGHESISTTEIYVHVNNQMLRQELLLHHPWYAQWEH